MSDVEELGAWRFLAAHRVGALRVSHVSFIDDGPVCRMNTPCQGFGCYDASAADSWGAAAILLAKELGWECPENTIGGPVTSFPISQSEGAEGISSAPIVSPPNGESSPNSLAIISPQTASTIGATGAAPECAESAEGN